MFGKKRYLGQSLNKGSMSSVDGGVTGKQKSWFVSKWVATGIHTIGFVTSVILFSISWHYNSGDKHPLHTFSSAHVVEKSFHNPMDHSYIAFDANIHPYHHLNDVVGDNKFEFDVVNNCFDTNARFCGLLPWQDGENLCNKDLDEMKTQLETEGYKPSGDDLMLLLESKGYEYHDVPRYWKKASEICKYESYMGTKVVVNEDSAFSLTSAHSVWVLWWTIWLIMSLSCLMSVKNAWKMSWRNDSQFSHDSLKRFGLQNWSVDQWNTIFDFVIFVLLLAFFVFFRNGYGYEAENSYALLKPNGSFAYSLLALVYSWVFLRTSTACKFDSDDEKPPNAGENPTKGYMSNFDSTPKLELDMSNFSNKIKADAYVQAGNTGRYPIEKYAFMQDFREQLNLEDYVKAHEDINFSHFQMTQLWTFPFLTLLVYIYDKNYDIDINVTLVFVLTMLYCIIDIFSKRLVQLQEMVAGFELDKENVARNHGLYTAGISVPSKIPTFFYRPSSFLVLAQIVVILIQAMIYWYVYHFFDKPKNTFTDKKFEGNGVQFQRVLTFYYIINVLFKLVRIVETALKYMTPTPKNDEPVKNKKDGSWILQQLKKHHVVENVCLISLFIILFVCWTAMINDTNKNVYQEINNCESPNMHPDANCMVYYKWMNNYDWNSATGIAISDYWNNAEAST